MITKCGSNKSQKNKSCMFFMIWIFFSLPLVLGSGLFFFRDAFEFKTNAKGQLLAPKLAQDIFRLDPKITLGKWHILYFSPEICHQNCQTKFDVLKNVCRALGKDETRVVLRKEIFSVSGPIDSVPSFKEGTVEEDSIVVVDPQGWIVTHYAPRNFHAKAVLEDLRRLLRFSHVG